VNSGDTVNAKIELAEGTGDKWNIIIEDVTEKKVFMNTVIYNSSKAYAEWIEERECYQDKLLPATAFGDSIGFGRRYTGGFDDAATINSIHGKMGSFAHQRINMQGEMSYTTAIETSEIGADSSSFSVHHVEDSSAKYYQLLLHALDNNPK
jgi:hypothetical protein